MVFYITIINERTVVVTVRVEEERVWGDLWAKVKKGESLFGKPFSFWYGLGSGKHLLTKRELPVLGNAVTFGSSDKESKK